MKEASTELCSAPIVPAPSGGSLGPFAVGGMRPVQPVLLRPATFAHRIRMAIIIGVLAIGCYTAILSGLAVFFSGALLTAQHTFNSIVDSGAEVGSSGGPLVHVASPSQADIERDSRRIPSQRVFFGF